MKPETIAELSSSYARVCPSLIEGVGIFAIREIPTGVTPFGEDLWETATNEELASLPQEVADLLRVYGLDNGDGTWCVPSSVKHIDIVCFLNSSSEPNIECKDQSFIALRDIKAGEELTINYDEL